MSEQTPVADNLVNEVKAPESAQKPSMQGTPSPAQDLRDLQALLTNGIFPGNVAPAIVKAYNLIEKMAVQVEKDAKA